MKRIKRALGLAVLLTAGVMAMGGCAGGEQAGSSAPGGEASEEQPTQSAASEDSSQPQRPDTARVEDLTDSYKQSLLQFKEPGSDAVIAQMETSMGDIRLVLYPAQAPKAVENFVVHAREGYYDGMIFHRVIDGFMIQSGDPEGTGYGGESIYKDEEGNPTYFEDEFSMELFNIRGALSMANPGYANTNQSQFFVVQSGAFQVLEEQLIQSGYGADENDQFVFDALTAGGWPEDVVAAYVKEGGYPTLDGKHTVFGMVTQGMDVVDKIAAVKTDIYLDAEGNRSDQPQRDPNDPEVSNKPLEDVIIKKVTIESAG